MHFREKFHPCIHACPENDPPPHACAHQSDEKEILTRSVSHKDHVFIFRRNASWLLFMNPGGKPIRAALQNQRSGYEKKWSNAGSFRPGLLDYRTDSGVWYAPIILQVLLPFLIVPIVLYTRVRQRAARNGAALPYLFPGRKVERPRSDLGSILSTFPFPRKDMITCIIR